MAKISKGDRVLVTDSANHGKTGQVFWEGPNKFGPGRRYGVRGDDGETYWVNEDGVRREAERFEPPAIEGAPLQGLRIVLTGELDFIGRAEATAALEALGAKVTGSVSGKTDLLFTGADPGRSKLDKARRLGTRIGDGAQLRALLETGSVQDAVKDPPTPAPGGKKEGKPGFRPAATLASLLRAVERYDDARTQQILNRIPAERRAAFLWEKVAHEDHGPSRPLQDALAQTAAKVPLETLAAALSIKGRASPFAYLPDVGTSMVDLLAHLVCADDGYLAEHVDRLPMQVQLGFWLARGRARGRGEAPVEIRNEALAQLPAHASDSGKTGSIQLGHVIDWLGIPLEEILEPGRAAIRSSTTPLSFMTAGCLLLDLPADEIVALSKRFDLRFFDESYFTWWLEKRREALPGEPLADQVRIIEALFGRARGDRSLDRSLNRVGKHVFNAIESAARGLAARFLDQGEPVPLSLLLTVTEHTESLEPWKRVLETLGESERAELLQRLEARLPERRRSMLGPLGLEVRGAAEVDVLIRQAEETVRRGNSVHNGEVVTNLGMLGEVALEPLARRVDELTDSIPDEDPRFQHYKAKRKVGALRAALGVALAKEAQGGKAAGERFLAYLGPEPRKVFSGSDDHPYAFFSSLRDARALFAHLPEERVRRWIDEWRARAPSAHLDERLARVLPGERKKLLFGGPSLAEQVGRIADATGLERTEPIYILERSTKKEAKKTLNRIGGRPKGLGEDAWPRGEWPYYPVLVLDLRTVPELEHRFPGARALCLLVDKPKAGFEACAVVPLSPEVCAQGIKGGRPFTAERVLVPAELFTERSPAGELAALRNLVRGAPARALGRPFFLQTEPSAGDAEGFVLQAGDRFMDINLGDGGELFLYGNDAFWECL